TGPRTCRQYVLGDRAEHAGAEFGECLTRAELFDGAVVMMVGRHAREHTADRGIALMAVSPICPPGATVARLSRSSRFWTLSTSGARSIAASTSSRTSL